MKICIQAGHSNIQYNSITALNGNTGAPNEMSFNVDIRDRVSDELRKRGFEVQGTDANANDDPNITDKDWDLFLSLHYDADVYGKGGGFADYPEPSTDGATAESQRIRKCISDEYFGFTGIANVYQRSNKNTRYYYMWNYLTAKTPCVLIECGVGMHIPDDWKILHFEREKVVEGLVRGICKAFDVSYDGTVPPVEEPCKVEKEKIIELEAIINTLKEDKKKLDDELVKSKTEVAQLQPKATQWDNLKAMYQIESATDMDAIVRALKEELATSQTGSVSIGVLKECKTALTAAKKESVKTVSKTVLIKELINRFTKK